jgi:hypothetical protein
MQTDANEPRNEHYISPVQVRKSQCGTGVPSLYIAILPGIPEYRYHYKHHDVSGLSYCDVCSSTCDHYLAYIAMFAAVPVIIMPQTIVMLQ